MTQPTRQQPGPWQTGTVERIDLTFGGPGNQWTIINGTKYATFWNWNVFMPKVGDEVLFREYWEPFWHEQPPVLHAEVKPTTAKGIDDDN